MKTSWEKTLIVVLTAAPMVLVAMAVANIARKEKAIRAASQLHVAIPPIGNPPQTDDPKILAGWKVYTGKGCVYCHGPGGVGHVKNPNAVGGEMPSLIKVGAGYTKAELELKIRQGVQEVGKDDPKGPSPPLFMPKWEGRLTKQELSDVADYLLSLLPKEEKAGW